MSDKYKPPFKPKFGDIIENGWASERNPHRKGIFIRKKRYSGRVNPGLHWVLTDGKGDLWELPIDKESKIRWVGTYVVESEVLAQLQADNAQLEKQHEEDAGVHCSDKITLEKFEEDNCELKAENAQLQAVVDKLPDKTKEALLTYRLEYTFASENPMDATRYRLVELLTPEGEPIDTGRREIDYLVDHILFKMGWKEKEAAGAADNNPPAAPTEPENGPGTQTDGKYDSEAAKIIREHYREATARTEELIKKRKR